MRKLFNKNNQTSDVIYAESLNRLLNKDELAFLQDASCVLFVTTQPFYEFYYDKFINLLKKEQKFHWYICPNNESINYIERYQKALNYIEEMRLPVNSIIVGAGNQKIYHLCGFLKETSIYLDDFTYIPTTVSGFLEALNGRANLLNASFSISARRYVLPDRLVYDTMLNELETKDTWVEGFFSLIKLGLANDAEVFEMLSNMSTNDVKKPFSPFLEMIVETQEKNQTDNVIYLLAFAKSFYHLTESHYLSGIQKEQIAFLLYFFWCLKKNTIDFDFKNFILWYEEMIKIDLTLPKQMNTYDLAESIIIELERFSEITAIETIGKSAIFEKPTMEEMYHVVESFKLIKNN